MSRKVALQLDPWERLNYAGDSTVSLAIEALRRGLEVYSYTPADLALQSGQPFARMQQVTHIDRAQGKVELSASVWQGFDDFSFVLVRQDPPYDMAYLTTTYMLERVPATVRVVNHPAGIRNAPEKLLVQHFPDLTPSTLISSQIDLLRAFRERHRRVILKPLYGYGGREIVLLDEGDDESALAPLLAAGLPLIMQRFLPGVTQGDKRILLIDGQPVGAINRVPPQGNIHANLRLGGVAEKTTLTPREQDICAALAPALQAQGLYFVGIDVIDGWLTEINVTSPTGIVQVNQLDGISVEEIFWAKLL